jgi:uncharacterized flavoprotein (TIGR03862 family)
VKKSVSIIGGGPSALLLAAFLDTEKFSVTLFEQNASLGRKLLLAGKGGFNVTHSEPISQFVERYTPPTFLREALLTFDNVALRDWFEKIGIPTYIGSSKRVYPTKDIKPIDVLNAFLAVLEKQAVTICPSYTWTGWSTKGLVFNNEVEVVSDFTVFALGGGSWKATGSDGAWLDLFQGQGIEVVPFQASNCAYRVNWPKEFIQREEANPLKNIAISCSGKTQKGEVVITRFGLEGNAIYALGPQIREALTKQQKAIVFVDLKPSLSCEVLSKKMNQSGLKNISDMLRKELKLSGTQIALLKTIVSKEEFLAIDLLARKIKNLPIELVGAGVIDEAISTVGGLSLTAVDKNFQLKEMKNQYCIGEMLDWDAPTGGYLLQASFSMGVYLARYLNKL